MESLAGHFLVASPHLPDPNFYHTVVLMIRHDEEGAFGVVLNRPLENTVSEIWKALGIKDIQNGQPIYLGGPVSGPLIAIHREEELSEGEIVEGVYYSTHKDHLNEIVDENHACRIFSGYSGWGEGQLERELSEGSWLTTPATESAIFAEADEQWKVIVARIGLEIIVPRGRARLVPPDPELN